MSKVTGKHRLVPKDAPVKAPAAPDTAPLREEWPEEPTVVRTKVPSAGTGPASEWALVVYAGHALGQVFPLAPGESVLGRSPQARVSLLDDEVSRLHAKVVLEDQGQGPSLLLQDLGSTNGTQLNGRPLAGPAPLKAGDRIGVGRHVLKVVAMDTLERAFHQTLLDQSTRDPLTGLANRAATLAELRVRFDLSRRHERPLCVVMADLDHFKRVNDTLGHAAGDAVLQAFGERVRANLRTSDFAGRIGGEEFVVILPETEMDGAEMFAQRLRTAAELSYASPGGAVGATCSLGVAQRRRSDPEPGVLLSRADAALYEAKAGGRNRVVLAPP